MGADDERSELQQLIAALRLKSNCFSQGPSVHISIHPYLKCFPWTYCVSGKCHIVLGQELTLLVLLIDAKAASVRSLKGPDLLENLVRPNASMTSRLSSAWEGDWVTVLHYLQDCKTRAAESH